MTIEIEPDILANELAEHLNGCVNDFIDMEWSGNDYTGEGSDYPTLNVPNMVKIIKEYLKR